MPQGLRKGPAALFWFVDMTEAKELFMEQIQSSKKAYYHLPGLFEFYEFYKRFLSLYRTHREYFYEWCEIGSIYGAPSGCIWGGGRVGCGDDRIADTVSLMREYAVSARLTFSNSLLRREHLADPFCNRICRLFSESSAASNGIILYSDLLLSYLMQKYPDFYFVSSTTKVITDFSQFRSELQRKEFSFVVPDFRLNHRNKVLETLSNEERSKVEFLCNECCDFGCSARKACYENVSRKCLGELCADHICASPDSNRGYRFSKAMSNPGFIGVTDIQEYYLPMGFSNFKIEGRGLGSAVLLEFILYYMTRPEYQLTVREEMYLDSMLDLF